MFKVYARLRTFFLGERPRAVPAWMQAIGMELGMRFDVGREPLPQTMTDALSKMEERSKEEGAARAPDAAPDQPEETRTHHAAA